MARFRALLVALAGVLVAAAAVLAITAPAADAAAQTPYRDHAVPGKIEAEHFDSGGSGVAYSDTTNRNLGGAFRTGTAVDVYDKVDEPGYAIRAVADTEWLEFTVDVPQAGSYVFDARAASNAERPGGLAVIVDSEFRGSINVQNTGGAWDWELFESQPISLTAGQHLIRLSFINSPSFAFDSFRISPSQGPFRVVAIPGTVHGWSTRLMCLRLVCMSLMLVLLPGLGLRGRCR